MEADWYYTAFFGNVGILVSLILLQIAILLFLYPLYKLSKSRLALMLLYSKTIASLLSTAVSLIIWIAFSIIYLKTSEWPSLKYLKWLEAPADLALRAHLLMMAYNRVHSIYFPFSYAKWTTKKNLRIFCGIAWTICIVSSATNRIMIENKLVLPAPFSSILTDVFNIYCPICALILYALIMAKFIWMKYNSQIDGSQLEKDHWRISLACLSSVVPFLLNRLGILISTFPFYQSSRVVIDINATITNHATTLSQISEEICLLIVCADFRKLVWNELGQIFGWLLFVFTMGHYRPNRIVDNYNGDNNNSLFLRTNNIVSTRTIAVRQNINTI